jgi:flagellar L-ring protein precursor FlgH
MQKNHHQYIAVLLLAAAAAVSGCRATNRPPMPSAVVTPPPQERVASADNPGSLFDPDGATMLFADARARRVGDIVLINVTESTLAKNKATTTADKQSSIDLQASAYLGKDKLPLIPGATVGADSLVNAGSLNNFEGDGETKRESTISTTVAARVTRVMGGGLMEVLGARETRVNGETQIVMVQGVIRDRDIDADNTISSTNMAEARIELYGEGILAEKQRPGWLARILDNVWPF